MEEWRLDELHFGQMLKYFRQRFPLTQAELARNIGLNRHKTISAWENGQLPTKSLDYLPDIISALGLNEREAVQLQRAAYVALRDPGEERRLGVRFFTPLRLQAYVSRAGLEAQLRKGLEERRSVVLQGSAGAGKSTLAVQLLHEASLEPQFPDGLLWIDASGLPTEQAYEEWCRAVGIHLWRGERYADAWHRWLADSKCRCLVVLDDVVTETVIPTLLGYPGPEVKVLVTTQLGNGVLAALSQCLGGEAPQVVLVGGVTAEEARQILETRLGRNLEAEEWATLGELGRQLGWHVTSLILLLTEDADKGYWEALQGLATQGNLPLMDMEALFRVQWERLPPAGQEGVESLGRYQDQASPFGVYYAAAVWELSPVLARRRLRQLERTGLVERLRSYDPVHLVPEVWRLQPVAQAVLCSPSRPPHRVRWRLRRAFMGRKIREWGGDIFQTPWQFSLLAGVWQLLLLPWELAGVLYLWVWKRWGQSKHWPLTSQFLAGTERSRLHTLREQGLQLPMEYILLHEATLVTIYRVLGVVLGVGVLAVGFYGALLFLPWLPLDARWRLSQLSSWFAAGYFALLLLAWEMIFLRIGWPLWVLTRLGVGGVGGRGLRWLAERWGCEDAVN